MTKTSADSISRTGYILYGAMSNAIQHFVSQIPESTPMLRIYNSNPPTPRDKCLDTQEIGDVADAMVELTNAFNVTNWVFISAATLNQSKLFASETTDSIQQQIEVNVLNYTLLLHAILPTMIKLRYGRVIYLSSFRSQIPAKGITLYSASKAFGESLTRTFGIEYGRFGISAVSVRMGYFEGGLLANRSSDEIKEFQNHVALRRLGRDHDLSSTIKFAIDNIYLNGGVIDLDGGLSF